MSQEELNKLKDKYSELLDHFVKLHNRYIFFIDKPHFLRPMREIRSISRDIEKTLQQIKQQVKPAFDEGVQNRRQARLLKKQKKQLGKKSSKQ